LDKEYFGNRMNTLVELLEKNDHYFEHSGNINRTDKELRHRYCSLIYDQLFEPLRNLPLDILEIGTCHGGSLILWHDFFPYANIVGVDNSDQVYHPVIDTYQRIALKFDDAYSDKFVSNLYLFDIIIDDGPHTLESHKKFIDLYLPQVRPGGLLIIEDIRNRDNAKILVDKVKHLNYDLHDSIDQTGNHDNLVLIVKV